LIVSGFGGEKSSKDAEASKSAAVEHPEPVRPVKPITMNRFRSSKTMSIAVRKSAFLFVFSIYHTNKKAEPTPAGPAFSIIPPYHP
jgi:hypothetical protein